MSKSYGNLTSFMYVSIFMPFYPKILHRSSYIQTYKDTFVSYNYYRFKKNIEKEVFYVNSILINFYRVQILSQKELFY